MAIRVGVVGAGGQAARSWYLPELHALGVDLVAVSSRSALRPERLAPFDAASTIQFVGENGWRELIELSPGVDALVVSTPNHLHAEITGEALMRGIHVLVEKPLCRSAAEGRSLAEVADTRPDLVSAVAYKHRYLPTYQAALRLMAEADLGRPLRARTHMSSLGPAAWNPEADWFADEARAGGGALLDLGVHKLDALLWLVDDRIAEAREAHLTTPPGSSVEESATVTFVSQRDLHVVVEASWRGREARDLVDIEFERGRIRLEGRDRLTWSSATDEDAVERHMPPPLNAAGMYRSQVLDLFMRAVQDGSTRDRLPTVHEGAQHVAAVLAAYLSARSGRAVTMAEAESATS